MWTKDDAENLRPENIAKQDHIEQEEILIPLAQIIEPGVIEVVKKTFLSKYGIEPPEWVKSGEFVDLYRAPKAEFLDTIASFVKARQKIGSSRR